MNRKRRWSDQDPSHEWHIRNTVIHTVCDAIEGFCEELCIWNTTDPFYGTNYETDCGIGPYVGIQESFVCPGCNRRIVAKFDILKEEGV